MTFRDVSVSNRSIPIALLAGLCLAVAGALSILSIRGFGQTFSFGFIPLLVLLIWPTRSNEIASLAIIFIAGVFTDWGTAGAIGQSSLIYICIWMLFRPEIRVDPYVFRRLFIVWVLIGIFSVILLSVTGVFIYRIAPDFKSFLTQFILATVFLPIVLGLRYWINARFFSREDWRR